MALPMVLCKLRVGGCGGRGVFMLLALQAKGEESHSRVWFGSEGGSGSSPSPLGLAL